MFNSRWLLACPTVTAQRSARGHLFKDFVDFFIACSNDRRCAAPLFYGGACMTRHGAIRPRLKSLFSDEAVKLKKTALRSMLICVCIKRNDVSCKPYARFCNSCPNLHWRYMGLGFYRINTWRIYKPTRPEKDQHRQLSLNMKLLLPSLKLKLSWFCQCDILNLDRGVIEVRYTNVISNFHPHKMINKNDNTALDA